MGQYTPVLLMALAGVLIGGAYSLRAQGLPKVAWISLGVLAVLALIAAYLKTL
jgi:hypothetical protein